MASKGDIVLAHLGTPKGGGSEVTRPAIVTEELVGNHVALSVFLTDTDPSNLDLGFMGSITGTVGTIPDSAPGILPGRWSTL